MSTDDTIRKRFRKGSEKVQKRFREGSERFRKVQKVQIVLSVGFQT